MPSCAEVAGGPGAAAAPGPRWPAVPNEIVIEVTSSCNLACSMCFNKNSFARAGRGPKEMSAGFIRDVIDGAAAAGVPRIRFTGGEPLLRRDLLDLMAHARAQGLSVSLNTNATCLDRRTLALLEVLVDRVLVPLNGFDEASDFEWTGRRGSFAEKCRGLELLRESRIALVRAGTVATSLNVSNLEKILEIVERYGLDDWEVYRPIPTLQSASIGCDGQGPGSDLPLLCEELTRLSTTRARPIAIANAVPFCAHDPARMDAVSLGALFDDGHSRFVVDPAGFAKPSYFIHLDIGDPRDVLGCWNHPFMRHMRALDFVPDACAECRYLGKCRGGSRFIAHLRSGDFGGQDPDARFAMA